MTHLYNPEHIETRFISDEEKYDAKGGYSAAKLLENNSFIIKGGGGAASLMERLKNLYIPLGLVSRRYPPKIHHSVEKSEDKCLDPTIFKELETLIFSNKMKTKDTRKNENHGDLNFTRKHRKNT